MWHIIQYSTENFPKISPLSAITVFVFVYLQTNLCPSKEKMSYRDRGGDRYDRGGDDYGRRGSSHREGGGFNRERATGCSLLFRNVAERTK
jgi:hypothetical protein